MKVSKITYIGAGNCKMIGNESPSQGREGREGDEAAAL